MAQNSRAYHGLPTSHNPEIHKDRLTVTQRWFRRLYLEARLENTNADFQRNAGSRAIVLHFGWCQSQIQRIPLLIKTLLIHSQAHNLTYIYNVSTLSLKILLSFSPSESWSRDISYSVGRNSPCFVTT